jgi:hypothetical protein
MRSPAGVGDDPYRQGRVEAPGLGPAKGILMADGQDESRIAIFKAVEQMCAAATEYSGPSGAAMLRDAAYAWRAATGGPQPGSVIVESN